ncbi:glycosyltransferase WbuB [Lachnoclostridium sp. An131]|uniref:glycosyltransferase family 4 protein n=1 Tax=Lachnoclostridium sp. An131 TaxID=1965555 RepID=UPI000B39E679|nr:glycosyltransferase family 4 protein [Lachnoclostridium sp. An131]OUQ27976.1 glycosyltransferase WbuB [Lachnoclostridium sp. An131]
MKKRLLIISQYFYPEQFRINDLCKEWVKRGYDVTVVTGIPNYPAGKFFKGYSWVKRRKEEYEGIHIVRLPLIPRGNSSLMLALNYISFVISGWFWSRFTKIEADKIFIFEVSPMTQALLGVWYKKRKKIPCYIYVQDLWPENVEIVTGIHNRKIIRAIDKMVDYIYKNCNLIFATSPSFVKRIEERESAWKNKKSKVRYWPQYAEEFYKPVPRKKLPDMPEDDSFKIVFTGNIGYAQGLDILPKAAAILKEKAVNCSFIIIGDGRYRETLEKEICSAGVQNMFHMLGRKKPEEIPAYLAWCDVAFISFADNPLFEMTIPAKLQSYMACGMPILAAASGETERIIREADCGMVCELGNAKALAESIYSMAKTGTEILEEMSKGARRYYCREFNRANLLDKIGKYLDK